MLPFPIVSSLSLPPVQGSTKSETHTGEIPRDPVASVPGLPRRVRERIESRSSGSSAGCDHSRRRRGDWRPLESRGRAFLRASPPPPYRQQVEHLRKLRGPSEPRGSACPCRKRVIRASGAVRAGASVRESRSEVCPHVVCSLTAGEGSGDARPRGPDGDRSRDAGRLPSLRWFRSCCGGPGTGVGGSLGVSHRACF